MTTYVLVHGAWHGGWCWQRVSEHLAAKGHRVYAPSLSGLADRAHALNRQTNLSTHIADIAELIRYESLRDIVLVGHSYGGMVITAVADRVPERLRAIVYVDAALPDAGESSLDQMLPERRERIVASVREHGFGWLAPPLPAAEFGVTEPLDAAWVNARLTAQPYAALIEPLWLTGQHKKVGKKVYVLASKNEKSAFRPVHERLLGDTGWICLTIASGHDVMVEKPEELATILAAL
jgi:pimeloyl-ACP methyl ester carboxylesterase